MNIEDIVLELEEAFCENADEPAGHGCGYGITEYGQEAILAIVKRIMPQTEKEDNIMSTETTATPVYVAVRTKSNYKVTAKAVILTSHKGTNMLLEKEEVAVLDDVLYKGFYSEDLAVYEARKDIEKLIKGGLKVKMEDVAVIARPF